MSTKKRIFIGSSAESHLVAEALQSLLRHDFDVTIWSQDVFLAAVGAFESLDEAVRAHTYGVFVFAPDDATVVRGLELHAPRMNVVFEMGYFAGVHGIRRTFVLEPKGEVVHSLSDLAGITKLQFDLPRFGLEGAPALGPAVYDIKRAVARDRVSYPRDHLGRQNVLDPTVTAITGVKNFGDHDGYCFAAKLGAGQSVKVAIRGHFRGADENEKASAWAFPMASINSHWERLPPLGIHGGAQSISAQGPGLAFKTVQFRDYVDVIELDVFEDDASTPTFSKKLIVS